jgi:hypothetical protein
MFCSPDSCSVSQTGKESVISPLRQGGLKNESLIGLYLLAIDVM